MKGFVTVEEAARLEGVDVTTIRRHIVIGHLKTRLADSISDNGKRKRLVDVYSLSTKGQIKFFDVKQEASALPSDPLNKTNEKARREALRILPIVRGAIEIQEGTRLYGCHGRKLADYASSHGTTPQTLYRWVTSYKKDGFSGLLPKNGTNRKSRVNPQVLEAIQSSWLSPKMPSQADVFQQILTFCRENMISAPSYKTVQRVIGKIPPSVASYHRSGKKKWLSDSAPKGVRDMTDLDVNEWWNSDHREFDCFVQVGNKVFRPWLTSWEDMRTRKIVSRWVGQSPNSRTVAISFREGVLTHGRPRHILIDNGKDFTCHYLNGKKRKVGKIQADTDSKGVFALLNVEVHNAIPYSAWSKMIERWHSNIKAWEKTLPGWCGKDNKERPEKLAAEIRDGKLLTLQQFTKLFDLWLESYNMRVHSAIGCAPNDLWLDVEREIPEERALDLLLMKEERRKVNPSGIRIFPRRYHYAAELGPYIGDYVTVRYDPNEAGKVHVFLDGGKKFLCTAIERKLLKMGAAEEDIKRNAREKSDAARRDREYRADLFKIHDNDTLLAAMVAENKRLRESEKEGPVVAVNSPKLRLVTKFDAQAKEIDSAPPVNEDLLPPSDQMQMDANEAYKDRVEEEFIERRRLQEEQKKLDEEEMMRVFIEPTGADSD